MNEEAQRLFKLFGLRSTKSQAKFGKDNGLGSRSMVWQYLHGRRPLSLAAATKFAGGLGVDVAEFSPRLAALRDQLVGRSAAAGTDDGFLRIQLVKVRISESQGRFTAEPRAEPGVVVALGTQWLRTRRLDGVDLMATDCPDEGMAPVLAMGDFVVINTADTTPEEATVYAVAYEGRLVIRRLFRDDGLWWLACDNSTSHRFIRKRLTEKHCFIIGKVVHRQGST
jgi:transcriptional regulator with XRE-family HTH domain